MKRIVRYLSIGLAVVLVGIGGVLVYVKFGLPNVGPAPDLTIEATAAQIERGRYLANHVNACLDCHSNRDWSRFSGPSLPGTLGKGGDRFGPELGFPGTIYSSNITPAGIGQQTDGELFRAITSGVKHNGKAIFPFMPYAAYGQMDQADVKAIIAYVRTLAPIVGRIPEPSIDFPVNFIMNTLPQKPTFQPRPDTSNVLAYGAYLVNAANCIACHTKQVQGKPVAGMEFAGGEAFNWQGGVIRVANITPDRETGLGYWPRDAFIARFKAYDPAGGYVPHAVRPGEKQSLMPWTMFAGMTESDLGAIYTYLRTLKPVRNRVETYSPTASVKQAVSDNE